MTPLVTSSLVSSTAGSARTASTPSSARNARTNCRAAGTLAGSGGRVIAATATALLPKVNHSFLPRTRFSNPAVLRAMPRPRTLEPETTRALHIPIQADLPVARWTTGLLVGCPVASVSRPDRGQLVEGPVGLEQLLER